MFSLYQICGKCQYRDHISEWIKVNRDKLTGDQLSCPKCGKIKQIE